MSKNCSIETKPTTSWASITRTDTAQYGDYPVKIIFPDRVTVSPKSVNISNRTSSSQSGQVTSSIKFIIGFGATSSTLDYEFSTTVLSSAKSVSLQKNRSTTWTPSSTVLLANKEFNITVDSTTISNLKTAKYSYMYVRVIQTTTTTNSNLSISNSGVTLSKYETTTSTFYTVVFEEQSYTLTLSRNITSRGSVSGGGTKYYNDSCSISATPGSGYNFTNWTTSSGGTIANASSASTTYTMPAANATVTANFGINSYTLTTAVSPSGSGTVTAGGSIQYGSTKSLTATASTGYSFSSWSKTAGTLSSTTSNPTTFTMGASAATVTANFTKNSYTLTTAVSPSGAGTVTAGGSIQYGSTKSLTATAATGYTFSSWSKTAGTLSSTTSNPTTFTMGTSAATVTANFTHNQYTLTLSTSPSGGGTATGGGTKYYADSCSISATAATGYSFVNWTTSSGGTIANASSASTTYTMPNGNATVTANFSINSYTLTVQASPSGGGTVTGGGSFNYGSTNTITATAATGYQFAGWSTTSGTLADASSATTTLTLAASDATVTATFTKIDYTVTTAANPVGSGTVSANPSTANYGDTVTLSQTPASGYDFDSWSSSPSVTITNGQFVMPASNVTITANYIVGNKLYFKSNGNWVEVSKAYKKINGSWVEQSDVTTVFDSQTSYVKGN